MRIALRAASLGLVAMVAATSRAQSPARWSVVAGAGPTVDGTYNVQGTWALRLESEQAIGVPSYVALSLSSPGAFSGACAEGVSLRASRASCFIRFPAIGAASAGVATP